MMLFLGRVQKYLLLTNTSIVNLHAYIHTCTHTHALYVQSELHKLQFELYLKWHIISYIRNLIYSYLYPGTSEKSL